ncbi:MAG: hypothetical protein ACQERJ_06530 [Bacillota bacterium]
MNRKLGIILLIIILLATGYYFLVYNKLEAKKDKAVVELSQKINKLEDNKKKLLTLKELQLKNKKLKEKLQEQSNTDFLTTKQINNFIIRLNGYQVVQDINFNSNPIQNLKLTFDLKGQFEEIYHFLAELKYSHNTQELIVNNTGEELGVSLILIFPIEGADQ